MTPEERKKRDLILINRALETGDTAAYSELMPISPLHLRTHYKANKFVM